MVRSLMIVSLISFSLGCSSSSNETATQDKAAATKTPANKAPANKAPANKDARAVKPTKGQVACKPVARHLTALNEKDIARAAIAPEQRSSAAKSVARLEANIATTCDQLWNDNTRRCLLKATDEQSIKRCKAHQFQEKPPTPVLPEVDERERLPTCKVVIAHLLTLATREVAASRAIPSAAKGMAMGKVARLAGMLEPMCMRGWPGRLKTCALAAKTVLELEPCRKHMPPSLRKLEETLTP